VIAQSHLCDCHGVRIDRNRQPSPLLSQHLVMHDGT
jgi:hypothetical protein